MHWKLWTGRPLIPQEGWKDDGRWKVWFAKDARDALVTADVSRLASMASITKSRYPPVKEDAEQAVQYWVAQSSLGKAVPSTDAQWEEFLKFGVPDEDALLHAIVQGRDEVVRRLLQSSNSRAMVTSRNFLAVRAAMVYQQVQCLELLLTHGHGDARLKAAWAVVPEMAEHGSNLNVVWEVLRRANGTVDASVWDNVILRGAVRTGNTNLLLFLATQDSVVKSLPPWWTQGLCDKADDSWDKDDVKPAPIG